MIADPLSRESVLDLLRDLIRIPSVNPTLAPKEAHGEATVATFARDWLQSRGMRAWLEEAAPGRPNMVAEAGDGTGPTLILCAHLDTVGTEGMTIPPFEPRIDGNRVYGRGSFDMKGGVTAVLSAAAAFGRSGSKGRVLVALVADEEYASVGATDFVKRHSGDACILTEASEGQLILAHKGFVWADVTTMGRAAHGSRWDIGESAIARMGRIISALDEHDRKELRRRVHPLVGPASMHCAMVEGGVGLSTYAPACRLQIERRTLPGETPEEVVREIEGVIRSVGEEAGVACRFARSPSTCDPQQTIAECVRRAAQSVTGATPRDIGVPYWMDAAIFAEAGIPAVDYGPSGAGAHEAVEWVDVDSVVTCARVLFAAAKLHGGAAGAKSRLP